MVTTVWFGINNGFSLLIFFAAYQCCGTDLCQVLHSGWPRSSFVPSKQGDWSQARGNLSSETAKDLTRTWRARHGKSACLWLQWWHLCRSFILMFLNCLRGVDGLAGQRILVYTLHWLDALYALHLVIYASELFRSSSPIRQIVAWTSFHLDASHSSFRLADFRFRTSP